MGRVVVGVCRAVGDGSARGKAWYALLCNRLNKTYELRCAVGEPISINETTFEMERLVSTVLNPTLTFTHYCSVYEIGTVYSCI